MERETYGIWKSKKDIFYFVSISMIIPTLVFNVAKKVIICMIIILLI